MYKVLHTKKKNNYQRMVIKNLQWDVDGIGLYEVEHQKIEIINCLKEGLNILVYLII